jgi:hypothetical protein
MIEMGLLKGFRGKKDQRMSLKKGLAIAGGLAVAGVGIAKGIKALRNRGKGKHRRKKSTLWYNKETARLKAKARYERTKIRG